MSGGISHFLNFLVIVSAVALIMSLYIQGIIPASLVIVALFLVPIALAIGGVTGFLIRAAIPILSILTLSITFGGGNIKNVTAIFGAFLMLIILILAFYVMFLPFRRH